MTDIAKGLSNDLAEIVERRGSSVVRVESSRMPGSGVVWSADGVIVAASHSIEGADGIEVGLADRANVPAALVGEIPRPTWRCSGCPRPASPSPCGPIPRASRWGTWSSASAGPGAAYGPASAS